MISTELFNTSSDFIFDEDEDFKTKICIDQHLRDVENALLELAKNGNIITDRIQALIDVDLKVCSEKYNTGDLLGLPDYASLMHLILMNPRSNAKFVRNRRDLLSNDIFYCDEEEIFYKDLQLIGDYGYYDKYSQDSEEGYIYQCSRNGKLYEIYCEFDGYNNLCCIVTSPVTYRMFLKKMRYGNFRLFIGLRHIIRRYIISNIN